ncbi:putative ribonuclease H-like domain-containing protein, partial [Tanacetum coccineum]
SDSSVKSSEPKSNDSTSCASTSSVSTSESEAEIESNVGTPIQEPIIVQDLPSFSCNSSDKNENTSRTSCNKNGYFNKKASHFRKNNSSASKSCFVCGSYLHLIKDCNYYETQYANDFDGVGYPQREPIWDNATRVTQTNQFVPQAVRLRSGKVSIPAARPNQVPAGRPKPVSTGRPKPVSTGAPVSTGKQYRPPPVHAGRRNSSSYDGDGWATAVKPSAGCSWKSYRNKIPYALLTGKTPSISHFKPFGCHVTILNTSDNLGKFDGKADEGYLVGYSASNRAYRVYNMANKRVEETMNLRFLEEKANIQGIGHEWSFDLDYLTDSLGYNRDKANQSAGTQDVSSNPAGFQDDDSDSDSDEQVILVPSYPSNNIPGAEPKDTSDAHSNEQVILVPSYPSNNIPGAEPKDTSDAQSNGVLVDTAEVIFQQELERLKDQEQRATSDAKRLGLGFTKDAEELQKRASAKTVPPGSIPVPTGSIPVPSGDTMVSPSDVPVPSGSPTDSFFDAKPTTRFSSPSDLGNNVPSPGIFSSTSYDDEFGADLNMLASTVEVSPVATKQINTVHPQSLFIGEPNSSVQTRSQVHKKTTGETAFLIEPRSVAQALENPSWVDAMQAEMQQFKFQNVWILVDLPEVARIKAIRLFLAFASYLGFMVYQMDVKSAFLYGRIDKEVYVTQPKGFVDPQHPKKVYKVVKALYGLHQAPRAWYATLSTFLLKHGYRRGTIDKTLFLKKHKRNIILVQVYVDDIIFGSKKKACQDKYVQEILKKFDLECVRTATTPYEAPKPKSKNEPDSPINVHLYRSMIGLLMYLTASRPDIMFAVSACSRNQVTHTTSNLEAVKKIFKYLKGQPKLGLWKIHSQKYILHALANAAVTVDSTKSPGGPSSNPAACSYDPTSDVPTTDVPTDVPSGVAPTGPSTVSPGSTTVPTSSSIPAAEPIPARSDKTFKQLEEERLGWEAAQRLQAQELADLEKQRAESLMKDANLARQMSQDFEMTEDQRKRQQEVLASAANYSDAAWDIILAPKMVALVNSRRKELAEQRAQERRDRPMTPAQLRQYMRCLMLIFISLLKVYVVPTGRVVVPTGRYVVPTGRVVVPTGRYVVPTGKVIIIVSLSRLNLVPTSRILSPGRVK